MKKTILAIAAVAVAATGFSQDLMSKKGEAYLPEAGDYALGFDAVPVFYSLKFNDANKSIGANYAHPYGIMVKRFIDAKTAHRFGISFGTGSEVTKLDVASYTDTLADNTTFVENKISQKNFNLALSAGKEFRRGNTRLQGYYGYEGMLMLSSGRTTIEYGNDFAEMPGVNPYVGQDPAYGSNAGVYVNEVRSGLTFGIGARAFFGVEYFIAPKISINAEYGFGVRLSTTPKGEQDITTIDSNGEVKTETKEGTLRTSSFKLGTDNSQGAVRLLFHF